VDINEANKLAKQAAAFFKEGWYEQAADLLEQIEEALPGNVKIRYNLAICLGRIGRTDDALDVCVQLQGELPQERMDKLQALVKQGKHAPVPTSFTSNMATDPAPGSGVSAPRPDFDNAPGQQKAAPQQQGKTQAKPPQFRHAAMGAWEPVSEVMLAGRAPALMTCGFTPEPDEKDHAAHLDGNPAHLSDNGWKAFVKLIEELILSSPKNTWVTGEAIHQSRQKALLQEFETVYRPGELMVALGVFKKTPLLITDRHLYYLDPIKDQSVPWGAIEGAIGVSDEADNHLEVRLRDARRIYMNLGGGLRAMTAPFTRFLNEVSFLYESEGTPIVVFPADVAAEDIVIPQICCGCMSEDISRAMPMQVRDPADPVEMIDDEEEESRGIGATLFGKRKKAVKTVLGAINFHRCAFCDWHHPVRIVTAGDGKRVFVFRNGHYALRFHEDNVRRVSEESSI
jgi:hypothetical protein